MVAELVVRTRLVSVPTEHLQPLLEKLVDTVVVLGQNMVEGLMQVELVTVQLEQEGLADMSRRPPAAVSAQHSPAQH